MGFHLLAKRERFFLFPSYGRNQLKILLDCPCRHPTPLIGLESFIYTRLGPRGPAFLIFSLAIQTAWPPVPSSIKLEIMFCSPRCCLRAPRLPPYGFDILSILASSMKLNHQLHGNPSFEAPPLAAAALSNLPSLESSS